MKKKIIEVQDEIGLFSVRGRAGRGGSRPGAGRKPLKANIKKKVKSFTLSTETQNALSDLQVALGLPSQSTVVEFLALKAHREICR